MRKAHILLMASQIRKSGVTLPALSLPHKITDDNQSILNGVVNEKFDVGLRSEVKSKRGRKRKPKP